MSVPRVVAAIVFALLPCAARAAPELGELEQQAFQAAVARIAPCVVQIETVGGDPKSSLAAGPTTGLILTPDGYVVSSAVPFLERPATVLVRLPGASRRAAKLVAVDHSRMLALLKVDAPQPLPTPEVAPAASFHVGQWTIAVGRTFDVDRPNLSVGILSAVGRIWGKALQTDAAVSASNYGGPLVDVAGRAMGVIAPLAPQGDAGHSGVEWYDSGIGFAVPLEDVYRVLPQWKQGADLRAGLLGVSVRSSAIFTDPMVIGSCHPNGPARKAGFKPGDQIIEILGQKVDRGAQFKQLLGPHYAGERIHVAALRGKTRIERDVQLVAELPPYVHPALGILPLRDPSDKSRPGLGVRWVEPGGPAAKAGVQSGDRLLRAADRPVNDRGQLLAIVSEMSSGDALSLAVERQGKTLALSVTLGPLAASTSTAELPPAQQAASTAAAPGATTRLKIPELPHEIWVYAPQQRTPSRACGLVVYVHGAEGVVPAQLIARWKAVCDRDGLLFAAPQAADKKQWKPTELAVLEKLLAQLDSQYTIDPDRVVVCGSGAGAQLALTAAFRFRDRVRGAALVDANAALRPPENDPAYRQTFFFVRPGAAAKRAVEALRKQKFPVAVKESAPGAADGAIAEMARWIDMLDRI